MTVPPPRLLIVARCRRDDDRTGRTCARPLWHAGDHDACPPSSEVVGLVEVGVVIPALDVVTLTDDHVLALRAAPGSSPVDLVRRHRCDVVLGKPCMGDLPRVPTEQERRYARQEVAEAWNVWRTRGEAWPHKLD
jgi:hypothetical protein